MNLPDTDVNDLNEFHSITPEVVLRAVEQVGLECTGRCLQLNSMENRVYEVEVECENPASVSDKFRVVKFYRPGRWSKVQIQEEHAFLLECAEQELTVVPPLVDPSGETVHELSEKVFFTVWPRRGGRNNPELNHQELETVGRLLGRLHNIGVRRPASSRLTLNPTVFGRENARFLTESGLLPQELQSSYLDLVNKLCDVCDPWFAATPVHRIHGDCHVGNVVWADAQPFLLDFDDMVMGPAVQDIWLLVPGRDEEAVRDRERLLTAYETFREFDWGSVRLIEPLRALRYINFSAWIARRRHDPYVQRTFPSAGTAGYWREQLADLHEQLERLHGAVV